MSDEQLITEEDVNGFKEQIEQWSQGLSDGERAVLQMVLVRAFGPEDDVMGFDATAPANT